MARLITSNDIIGFVARWAVQQHPYKRPEGLFEVVELIDSAARDDFADGVHSLPMQWFNDTIEIRRWLSKTLHDNPHLRRWNTPRSGNQEPFVFVSRYGGPSPENDFIDLDALFMNVALDAWNAAEEFDKAAATS